MKMKTIDRNNTIFVSIANKRDCKYNVLQKENGLEIVFSEDGVFSTRNRRLCLGGFIRSYKFTTMVDANGNMKVNTYTCGGENLHIEGVRKKRINLPKIFPRFIPMWDTCIEKSKSWGFGTSSRNRVVEFYNTNNFKGIVLYDAEDPTLPDFDALRQLFGKNFQYLGNSVRFKPGENSLQNIVEILLKRDRKKLVSFKSEIGDFIITKEENEGQIFREISLTPEDREAINLADATDDTTGLILDALSKALEVAKDCRNLGKEVSSDYQILYNALQGVSSRISALEQRLQSIESAPKTKTKLDETITYDSLDDVGDLF